MTNEATIRAQLLEDDGWCRDINLAKSLTRNATQKVLDILASEWSLVSSYDNNGAKYSLAESKGIIKGRNGSLLMEWTRSDFIPRVQMYICLEQDDQWSVEITFFPCDLDSSHFDVRKFFAFLASLVRASGQAEYYVRYENVSWRHGNNPLAEEIILSHKHGFALEG